MWRHEGYKNPHTAPLGYFQSQSVLHQIARKDKEDAYENGYTAAIEALVKWLNELCKDLNHAHYASCTVFHPHPRFCCFDCWQTLKEGE